MARTRSVRSMTLESTRIAASCRTITQIRTVAVVPASYRAPTHSARKSGSQTIAVAAAADGHQPRQDHGLGPDAGGARQVAPRPTRPPRPGIVAEITMNTTSLIAWGT